MARFYATEHGTSSLGPDYDGEHHPVKKIVPGGIYSFTESIISMHHRWRSCRLRSCCRRSAHRRANALADTKAGHDRGVVV